MSKLLVSVLVVVCAASLVAATEWMEPQYTDAAEVEPSLIEEGGVPVTVGGRKGMVTYISPARHVQTGGIVFTPAPHMQIESNVDPRLGGIINPVTGQRIYQQPLYVQPVYRPYRIADERAEDMSVEQRTSRSARDRSMAERSAGAGPIVTPSGRVMTPIPNEQTVDEIINAPFRSAKGSHFGHRHQRRHRGHKHARGDLAMALARRGMTAGSAPVTGSGRAIAASIARAADARANPASVVREYRSYSPEAVPVSLLNHPIHPAHYGHTSDSVSEGIITVPHSQRDGKITLEAAEYVGYNAGPVYQADSVPTGHFSDGSAYPASINQRFN